MEISATAKWVKTTAQKARLVSATVEGLPVNEALTILGYTPRAAAEDVAKVIRSAAANAEHNYNMDGDSLRVVRVEVDGAGIRKGIRAGSRGHVGSKFRRSAHLTAVVESVEREARRRSASPSASSGVSAGRTAVPAAAGSATTAASETASAASAVKDEGPRSKKASADKGAEPGNRAGQPGASTEGEDK